MTTLNTWVSVPENSDFSIYNLPFGIFSINADAPRAGIAIGEQIVDLAAVSELGLLDVDATFFRQKTLNEFIALGKKTTNKVRLDIQKILVIENSPLKNHPEVFVLQKDATMHLPVQVGDYTDFYSSIEHATNVGKIFRGGENALMPNWMHMPVAYHGRSSSIIPSGIPVHRPQGQKLPNGATKPIFGPSRQLDFELEMAFITTDANELGQPIPADQAEEYIFGMVLFNDWSARDIQRWEYVPLGPFLGKNFASSVSPWIVTLDALEPFRTTSPKREEELLPYLNYSGKKTFDINLQVSIKPEDKAETIVSKSNFKYLYWNMSQQLAHHTINGCPVNSGDMMGSGTISGPTPDSYGSMLELSWKGSKPVKLTEGGDRKYIEDNDTVIVRGHCEKAGAARIGFGEVTTKILPVFKHKKK